MTELDQNIKSETPNVEQKLPVPEVRKKTKRDVLHFTGETPSAVCLDHIVFIRREGKTIFFDSYTKTMPVDMADEDTAKSFYPVILNMWAGDASDDKKCQDV